MQADGGRWHEVSRSEFAHEREGLAHVRELLPDRGPFHAWSNFEFRDSQGRWAEVDLLVLGEGRLHLVELKHYQGDLQGTSYRWQRGHRSEDSPLMLARRKAQRISSVLKDAARRLHLPPERVPFVQESIFLHAANHRCLLDPADKTDLFGLDGAEQHSLLTSIGERLMEPDRGRHDRRPMAESDLLRVVTEAGFAVRREREVGSWKLSPAPLGEGEGWQDWAAEHRVAAGDRARIRFFLVPDGASAGQIAGRRTLVEREFRLTSRLRHDGVLSPRDLVDHELGAGLVYPYDPADQRLDLWLADHGRASSLAEQVGLLRQMAEAVQYAHANGVVHRGLNPTAVLVRSADKPVNQPTQTQRVRVGGWQVAGLAEDAGSEILATQGRATRIFGALDQRSQPDRDERLADVYVAPEGQWSPHAHRVKLDVFALGALAYLLVTGEPPATSALDLKQRLAREGGLDVAAALPEAPTAMRALVQQATEPRVSERLRDVSVFLERLSEVERALASAGDTVIDPLEAPPGTLLGDRFELVRRLGSGSTAVGLLVVDQRAEGARRVLKVALDDAAARRLQDEAEVLAGLGALKHQRLVRLIEADPVLVGDRTALVLESAGEETLGDILRERRRLSLDLLERWGIDLLEALVALDTAGVDHRDIKPANLGVREQRSDRAKHLVLFDFSLSRASAATLGAGTPPYLDPFLGSGSRSHWDSAAERYAAAVTLFEMATGHPPVYGDGASDPAVIDDPATVTGADFDPAVADAMVEFFGCALARNAADRFGTATEMLTAWRTALSATATTVGDDADALAQRADLDTALPQSGLTPRALSALEPFRLATVGDLAGLDTGRLSRFAGIVDVTKREIRTRAKQWRETYADELRQRREEHDTGRDEDEDPPEDPLADPALTALTLITVARGRRASAKGAAASVLLGTEGDVSAFATLDQLAGPLNLGGAAQVSTALGAVRDAWVDHVYAAQLLDDVADRAFAALGDLDGAAWADDLAEALAPTSASAGDRRIVAGLVRAAVDRADDKAKGADEETPVVRRRRRTDSRLMLALDPDVAAAAGRLGGAADRLIAAAGEVHEHVVTRGRSVPALRPIWSTGLPALDDVALVRLAGRMSNDAAASPSGELYARAIPAVDAVRLSFGATTAGQRFSVDDVRRFVRVRFPLAAGLPGRPDLDDVLRRAETGLEWTGSDYAVPSAHSATTFLTQTRITSIPIRRPGAETSHDPAMRELADSVRSSSFLALGIRDRRVETLTQDLLTVFSGVEVNVTDLLLDALRERIQTTSLQWEQVLAADAAAPGTREAQGLAMLVEQVMPTVEAAIEAAIGDAPEASRPVLLTEVAPLARYGHLGLVARLADVGQHRANAVWLVVPQGHDGGAHLDGIPVPRSYASQFVTLDDLALTGSSGRPHDPPPSTRTQGNT